MKFHVDNNTFLLLLTKKFHCRNPKMILRELGMNASNYELDVSMIFLHLIIFKVLAYLMLKRRLKIES